MTCIELKEMLNPIQNMYLIKLGINIMSISVDDMLGSEVLRPRSVDLLSGGIPSLIPSPDLKPEESQLPLNLMSFEANPGMYQLIHM